MKPLLKMLDYFGDRTNAVAVREFRQAVQSRWVVAVLMLFLLVNLGVIASFLMLTTSPETNMTLGQEIITALMAVLTLTCAWFVPVYTGVRLTFERNDSNADLLFVSTLTPGAIIRGKLLAATGLTLLIFSTCMPFLVLTYLLRGVDLPTIFFVLAFAFSVCVLANALGVLAGSIGGTAIIRGIVHVGIVIALLYLGIGTVAMVGATLQMGTGWMFGGRSAWWQYSLYLGSEALGVGLAYVLAVAMISPKTSNRMVIPRIYMTVVWAVVGVGLGLWAEYKNQIDWLLPWTFVSSAILIVLVVTSFAERDSWSPRVRRKIPRSIFLRPLALLFYTGSLGGMIWTALLFAGTIAGTLAAFDLIPTSVRLVKDLRESVLVFSILFGYMLCYCLTIAALRPWLLKRLPTPNLAVLAAFFGVVTCLVPYFIAFYRDERWQHSLPWYVLGNPMALAMNYNAAKEVVGYVVLVWLAVAIVAALPWAFGQWRRFQPREVAMVEKEGLGIRD